MGTVRDSFEMEMRHTLCVAMALIVLAGAVPISPSKDSTSLGQGPERHHDPTDHGPKQIGPKVLARGDNKIFQDVKAALPQLHLKAPPQGAFMKEAAKESKAEAKKDHLEPPKKGGSKKKGTSLIETNEWTQPGRSTAVEMVRLSRRVANTNDLGEGLHPSTASSHKKTVLAGYKHPPLMSAGEIAEKLQIDSKVSQIKNGVKQAKH